MRPVAFSLEPAPPFRLDLTVWALRRQEELRRLKFSRQKARALIELSNAVVEGELNLEGLALLNDEAAVARLLQLWGVGRWTAEYTLLRGLGGCISSPETTSARAIICNAGCV